MKAQAGLHPVFSFLGALFVCYLISFIGEQGANQGLAGWYQILQLPGWGPPVWLFVPMWTVVSGVTGVALWILFRQDALTKPVAMSVCGISLLLGGTWPWLFFAEHLLFAATAVAAIQWIVGSLSLFLFLRISKLAGLLLLPYLLWILFLAVLSFMVWHLNPTGGGVKTVSELSSLWLNA